MASAANYGLKALITAIRSCDVPDCECKSDPEINRAKVNDKLQPSHRITKTAFNAICLDLDQNPITDRPSTSAGEKQRDDGNFDRAVEEAFKEFRDKEREITLKSSKGCYVGERKISRKQGKPGNKFWMCAAHLRHHLEFLLVLKGLKPCLLLVKYRPENEPLFSTVVLDCLVPVMDRFDLWSYGFSISFHTGSWVFYDTRSPKVSLVKEVFLTHHDDPVPERVVAEALGYPVHFDDWQDGRFVTMRDATELKVLVSRGWPEKDSCCVQGMSFTCPEGDETVWKEVLDVYHRYRRAALSLGTELVLFIGGYREMIDWLMEKPHMLEGPVEIQRYGGPTLNEVIDRAEDLDLEGDDLKDLLKGQDLEGVDFDELFEVLAESKEKAEMMFSDENFDS
ncbi:hypothetical protein SLS64_011430 [Diaporthe eres]|uniref:HNH nuclease domain-containing protein n=1 Tax=Diaporthe eres TaxID=83184 RepID=A0ABR1NTH4_DIAER